MPAIDDLRSPPAPHEAAKAPGDLTDDRKSFRKYFCRALDRQEPGANCDDWLHRTADEDAIPGPARIATEPLLDVILVTGAFSECFGENARPFNSAIAALSDTGHGFHTILVGGRSGVQHNAGQIAEFFAGLPAESERPRILVGYSKGTSDLLRFLADYPDYAASVEAVVSIAGSVYGSPLADRFDWLYHILFSHLPMNRCDGGDGGVVHSLRTDVRRPWMEQASLPEHIRYYSLAAFTTRERMARSLVPAWKLLLRMDRHNDGQILATDALIPGSVVLGYLNADHWAVAMEIEQELESLAHRQDPATFPHTALLDAMLKYVQAELSGTDPS